MLRRIVTAGGTIKLNPGGQVAFQQWQEGLMMAVSHPSPVEQHVMIERRDSMRDSMSDTDSPPKEYAV